MAKITHLLFDVAVIQLTEPTSIHEEPSFLARTEVGGVPVLGNRSSSALAAAQSLFYVLTGAGAGEKAQEASVGLALACAGTDMESIDTDLRAPAGKDLFELPETKVPPAAPATDG